MDDLTPEERRAIAALKRLAKRWPQTIMLVSDGDLHVVRCAAYEAGKPRSLDVIDGIPNDGGDPW